MQIPSLVYLRQCFLAKLQCQDSDTKMKICAEKLATLLPAWLLKPNISFPSISCRKGGSLSSLSMQRRTKSNERLVFYQDTFGNNIQTHIKKFAKSVNTVIPMCANKNPPIGCVSILFDIMCFFQSKFQPSESLLFFKNHSSVGRRARFQCTGTQMNSEDCRWTAAAGRAFNAKDVFQAGRRPWKQ